MYQLSVRWIWCGRYCWCLAGHWGRVDFLGVVFVQVGSGVGCVVLCVSLYLDFVDFFILFGLWCRLRCS